MTHFVEKQGESYCINEPKKYWKDTLNFRVGYPESFGFVNTRQDPGEVS